MELFDIQTLETSKGAVTNCKYIKPSLGIKVSITRCDSDQQAMKFFIVLLPLVAGCFAGNASYTQGAQRGLLVLPKPAPFGSLPASYDQTQGQFTTKDNYKQQPQTPEILRPEFAERRGVYFVEVPQERIQALRGYTQQQQNFQPSAPAQYSQEESFVRYLPLQPAPSIQYREEQPLEAVVRYLPVPLGGEAPRQESAAVQEAVVQYSEVQPISGPVYSYSPAGLTRVLRYAPIY